MAIALVELRPTPKHPPGEGMAELAGQQILHKTSNVHLFSETGAPTAYELFNIPPDTFIVDVILEVTAVYNGSSAAMTVGDGGDPDRYIDDTIAALATAGFKSAKGDLNPGSGGHLYTAVDTLDLTWTHGATGASTGACKVHIFYIRDWSKFA
jgi:hypothetical protein